MTKLFLISLILFSALLKAEVRDPSTQSFKIYPKMMLQEGSDFSDIENSYNTTRRDVRRQFIYDYRSQYFSYPYQDTLMIFDQMYDLHKQIAIQNFSKSFESSLRAELDRLSDFYHAPVKRLVFSFAPDKPIDFFLLGIYSHVGAGVFRVSMTFLKLPSGETQTFEETDYPESVHLSLAKKIFNYFYGNRFAPYENPQNSKLAFLLPAPMDQGKLVDATDASNYCSAINARLPYARELVLARAMGPYHNGGMDLIANVYYVVADETYWSEQYFYYNGKIEPINKMRTAAGMGNLRAAYFCVRGEPSNVIQNEKVLWEKLRGIRRQISSFEWEKNPDLNALECQLKKSGTPMFLFNADACR